MQYKYAYYNIFNDYNYLIKQLSSHDHKYLLNSANYLYMYEYEPYFKFSYDIYDCVLEIINYIIIASYLFYVQMHTIICCHVGLINLYR